MRKFLIAFTFLALATAANAQFVVSAQLGGNFATGNMSSQLQYVDSIGPHSEITDTPFANQLSTTGGIKFGYQFGSLQVGLCASFSWSHTHADQSGSQYYLANPANPYITSAETFDMENYIGWYTQHASALTIAPYARYEFIQLGDVAFFAELNGYFCKSFKPVKHDYLDWTWFDLHNTIDTTYNIDLSSVSLGAKVTPGLSWQLTPHCGIDLYLDVLALCFDYTTITEITVVDEFDYTASPRVLARRTTTTTVSSSTALGFGPSGSHQLSGNDRNWVRVGFNYTF